jgi:hypothetical protein
MSKPDARREQAGQMTGTPTGLMKPSAGLRESGRREAVKNEGAAQPPPVRTWLRREAQSVFATKGSNKPEGRGGF